MTVAVLIPTGGTDPHRARALGLVRDYYAGLFPTWPVVPVEGANVNKGEALNAAAERLGEHIDVLVLNDGDSVVPPHQVTLAVALAQNAPGLVFAYSRYRRIDEETTRQVTAGDLPVFTVRDDQVEWEKLNAGSHGCIAIQRRCWETAGGLDPAFGMAGYEDLAFNTVCEAFWPSRRVAGDLFHLWHPRGWDSDPAREAANLTRYREYQERWDDREGLLEMRWGCALT